MIMISRTIISRCLLAAAASFTAGVFIGSLYPIDTNLMSKIYGVIVGVLGGT